MKRLFRLDGKGAGIALGPLETEVMEAVWHHGGWLAVSEMHETLQKKKRSLSYSTIKTILNNLAEKGHLHKRSAGRANEFSAVLTKQAFDASVVGDVLKPLIRNYRNPLLAHIVNELHTDTDIAELERLLAQKKANRRG
jgi:predicted transcriptional regulator